MVRRIRGTFTWIKKTGNLNFGAGSKRGVDTNDQIVYLLIVSNVWTRCMILGFIHSTNARIRIFYVFYSAFLHLPFHSQSMAARI